MIIYFQSISDIITNSSSEIFTIYRESDIETIKDVVNSILEISGSKYKFDDLFTAELIISEYAELDYEDDKHKWRNEEISFEEYVKKHDEYCIDIGEGYLYIQGIKITAKDSKNDFAAKQLTNLGDLFDKIVLYS